MDMDTQIVAVGGFPGSGKSSVAGLLAADLRIPLLASDLLGDTIKGVFDQHLAGRVPSSLTSRAGYATLFALVDEFVTHRCSVVVDLSLGWSFQWNELDDICGRRPDVVLRPFILECSRQICLDRLHERHLHAPQSHPPVEEFMRQPQLDAVGQLLSAVDRPDVRRIDADRPVDEVYADIRQRLTDPAESTAE